MFEQQKKYQGFFDIKIVCVFLSILLINATPVIAQSDLFIPLENESNLIDRMEIKFGSGFDSQFKPYRRKAVVERLENILLEDQKLSEVDKENITVMLNNGAEWVWNKALIKQRQPFFSHFFHTPYTFYEHNDSAFFVHVNPVLGYHQSFDNTPGAAFVNSRGLTARGQINNRIGFQFYLTDNQEISPGYVYDRMLKTRSIPGVPTFKDFKGKGVDYFDSRASFNVILSKSIQVHAGFDKIAIGSGYRSVLLSEQASSTLFVSLYANHKNFSYRSVLMEIFPGLIGSKPGVYPRNYLKLNYFSYSISRSVNVAGYYSTVYGQLNKFHPLYLLPVLNLHPGGTRSIDNNLLGVDVKVNLWRKMQIYGQVMMDRIAKRGSVAARNRYAYQFGIKYPDIFKLKNLDIQVEVNRVDPFTYSSADSVTNYTHANQPLAHPLGSNFSEMIALVKYQPSKKISFRALAAFYYQGKDTLGANYGGNIFLSNEIGYLHQASRLGEGNRVECFNTSLLVSYHLVPNLFIESAIQYRFVKDATAWSDRSTIYTLGISYNFRRREYIF